MKKYNRYNVKDLFMEVQNPVICSVSHRLSVCVCVNIYLTSAHAQSGSKDVYIAQ